MCPHDSNHNGRWYKTCRLKRVITYNSENSVQTVSIIGITCILLQLGLLQRTRLHTSLLEETVEEMSETIEKPSIMRTFALTLIVKSIFFHENGLSLIVFKSSNLKCVICCNSENSVQTVIINGNMCILWQTYVLNVFLH